MPSRRLPASDSIGVFLLMRAISASTRSAIGLWGRRTLPALARASSDKASSVASCPLL